MKLLSTALCLTLLLCSNAQSQTPVTSADCDSVETDAAVALDLINKHRRDGYIFTLFRVADAHEQQTGNSSVLYLTLNVLETQCSVLSRRHWEDCKLPQHNEMVFGQCKTIMYINRQLKKEILHGYNCTVSPDHSQLYKCEQNCPRRPTALEDIEQHRGDAERALERYNEDSNHTQYFKVDKVQRATVQITPQPGYFVEFTIKETCCSKSTPHANVSECEFLHDRHAHVGFCRGKFASDTKNPDVLEISCEIYDPWCDRPPFHHHPHSGEHHHHHHFSGQGHPHPGPHRHHHHHSFGPGHPKRHYHRCPPPPENRVLHPEGSEHHHNFSEEEHKHGPPHLSPSGPHYPPPPPGRPHDRHHYPGFGPGHRQRHYHRCPPPPENRVLHPEGSEHHHNFSEEEHKHGPPHLSPSGPHYPPPPPGRPHDRHHYPGFGPGHRQRHYHRCPPPPENRVLHPEGSEHHHNFSEEEHQHGCPHLPPSGPHYPPPPPGRPHDRHHYPGFGPGHRQRHYHRCPPPPENRVIHPEGSEHHHNFSGEEHQHGRPHLPHPPGPHYPPPPYGCKHGHRHNRLHHQRSSNFSQERGGHEGSSSEEHISSQTPHPFHKRQVGSIHHIPVLNQHDVLPAPAANFPDHPPAPQNPFCKYLSEKPAIQPFPQAPSESKSCPGKPKYDLPDLLPLFPLRSTQ
ncbi:histidine-rich glycoprotein isoform X1 [Chrysemys picta bellii]|uniref:histidine-rich glycoprotein isoform X1 n=1 Tax=Chrysemys picta bellii TaxID=8478 RepID=UPI0032B19422